VVDIRDETFNGTFPFVPRYRCVNGFDMHFVDEGEGEPLVFVHGDPTWGYLWRRFIPPLSARYRCVVPDHMGMGKSAVPPERDRYRLAQHIANLECLLLDLDLSGITLVLHDWGGPVGLGFAARHRDRVKRLALMNTWAFAPWPGAPLPRLLEIIRSPRGEHFVLERNGYVEPALTGGTHRREHITAEVLKAYLAPFPTPESRLALLSWTRDIPVREGDPSFDDMKRIERALPDFARAPALLLWGMRDPVLTAPVLAMWKRALPGASTVTVQDAGHFLQEDAPESVVIALERFLAAHP
jgi:haloalkane dehalogenase